MTANRNGVIDNEYISSKGSVYTVEVDYSVNAEDVSYRYDSVSAYAESKYIPLQRTGVEKAVLHLIRFKHKHTYDEPCYIGCPRNTEEDLPDFLKRQGLRSANMQELLALDAQQSHLRKKTAYTLAEVYKAPDGVSILPGIMMHNGLVYLANLYQYHLITPDGNTKFDGIWRMVVVRNS